MASPDADPGVPQASRAQWDEQYGSDRWRYLSSPAEQARYAALADRILAASASAVLDVGCGSGVLRDCLGARFSGRYVGMDWSRTALAARSRWPGEMLVCADAARLPLRGRFDTVVLSEVLYYLDDPVGTVHRLRRLVVAGGELLVSLYQPPADRHPGWRHLISGLDAAVSRLAGDGGALIGDTGRRSWQLHVLRSEARP